MEPNTLFLILVGFSAGFVDSVAGGGGLISLPALLALGLPPHLALGTNKAIGISTAIASSSRYWISKAVSWRSVGILAPAAALASFAGALCATLVEASVLRPIILIGLVGAGIYTLTRRGFGLQNQASTQRSRWMFPLALSIGFYDGFFGPGTGTFLMMTFVLLAGYDLLKSAAHSRVVNFSTNLGAIVLFSTRGFVDFDFVLPASLASFVGGLLGASWAVRKGARAIRPVFIVVTWLLIAKVAYDLFQNRSL